MTLTPEQRELVMRVAFQPRAEARDYTSVGCASLILALAGTVLFRALPAGFRHRIGVVAPIVLVAVAVFGVAFWLLGYTIGMAPIHRRIEAALATLAAEGERGSDAAVEAAVSLLLDAYHAPGPYTAATFEPEEMEPRLGPALPLVLAVEAVLLEEGRIYPVFTTPPAEPS